MFDLTALAILGVKVLRFLLSYIAGFCIVLLVASAIDTAGLVLLPVFGRLKRIVLASVLAVSALGTYLGVVAYCWLVSITSLHVSCAMITLVVIVEWSHDSAQYRTARARALLADDRMPEGRRDATIAQVKAIGHAFGFAVAAVAHLRGSPAF